MKKSKRIDRYGETIFINDEGSNRTVVNIKYGVEEEDKELHEAMKALSDSLDESYSKIDMDQFFEDLSKEFEEKENKQK